MPVGFFAGIFTGTAKKTAKIEKRHCPELLRRSIPRYFKLAFVVWGFGGRRKQLS